jgi:hypothetical protein
MDGTEKTTHRSLKPGTLLHCGSATGYPFYWVTGVNTDPEIRPNPGFLTANQWRRAFTRAGFQRAEVMPEIDRIREMYSHFSRAPSADSAPPQMVFDNRCSEKRLELSIDNTVARFNPSEIVETQPLIHVGALPPERTELRLLDYLASASH